MRLRGVRKSRNVQVRRGRGGGAVGGLGLAGVILILTVGYFTGVDVTPLLVGDDRGLSRSGGELSAADQRVVDFSSRVLATTEDVWTAVFERQLGGRYTPPQLVIFSGVTQSGCGGASGATGPFYCPSDRTAYLDTQFFRVLADRMGAGGDFAAAYVIGHEIAHHVQNELGILGQVDAARRQASRVEANALTVRLELQADCLSGVWGRNVEGLLEPGDLEEALNAARKIGDDYLQRQAGQVPQPHTFTHGTSEQRQRWFGRGFESGDVQDCDTFGAARL